MTFNELRAAASDSALRHGVRVHVHQGDQWGVIEDRWLADADMGEIVICTRPTPRGRHVVLVGTPSQGHNGTRIDMVKATPEAVDRLVARGAALQRRDRLVEGHGHPHTPSPAWSFVAHPVLLRLLRIAGADPDQYTRPATWRTHTRNLSAARTWQGARERERVRLHQPEPFGPGGAGVAELASRGSRIDTSVLSMTLGSVRIVAGARAGRLELDLPFLLPGSTLPGLKGMRLDEVVHADWGDAGATRIHSATVALREGRTGERTYITLERGLASVAPSPLGPEAETMILGAA